jgi:hypothetical protein
MWIILRVTGWVAGLRVGPAGQAEGLDLGEYGETGYQIGIPG